MRSRVPEDVAALGVGQMPEKLVVAATRMESLSVKSVELAAPEGAVLPPWEPGAHLEIELANGLIRHYSLCGDPTDRTSWRIAVLREPAGRGGSQYVHDELQPGHTVRLRRMRNNFALEPAARYVFSAGGIGVTPILPMLRRCRNEGRPYTLHYCGQSLESMAFVDELTSLPSVEVVATGPDGFLDVDGALNHATPGTAVYTCGPAGLIAAVERSAENRGLEFHCERFVAPNIEQDQAVGPASGFEVTLASTGQTYTVPPDKSILEVLEANDIPVDFSCREGTCGTCEVTVLRGTPDHRDFVLDDEERAGGETMMLCVSRCLSERLELDL